MTLLTTQTASLAALEQLARTASAAGADNALTDDECLVVGSAVVAELVSRFALPRPSLLAEMAGCTFGTGASSARLDQLVPVVTGEFALRVAAVGSAYATLLAKAWSLHAQLPISQKGHFLSHAPKVVCEGRAHDVLAVAKAMLESKQDCQGAQAGDITLPCGSSIQVPAAVAERANREAWNSEPAQTHKVVDMRTWKKSSIPQAA